MEVIPDDAEAVAIYAQLQSQRGTGGKCDRGWNMVEGPSQQCRRLAILGTLRKIRAEMRGRRKTTKKAIAIQPAQPVAANNLAYLMLKNGETLTWP